MRKYIMLCSIVLLWCGTAHAINLEAIKQIESGGNAGAYNVKSGAVGLYQITPICLQEYNERMNNHLTMEDLYEPRINEQVASWYLFDRIPQMLKHFGYEVTDANVLVCYNAGIWYIVNDRPLPDETIEYIKRYKERRVK